MAIKKELLRVEAKRLRAGCDPALGKQMAAHVLRDCLPPAGAVVGGFWPLPGEIDTRYLLHELTERGYDVALPETPALGHALVFRKWQPGDALITGKFGTQHPSGAVLTPDFMLVPLLAFDGAGNRLGYGAGYYDRTLAALPGVYRLGCGFSVQKMEHIPVGLDDIKLYAVATEHELRVF